MCPTKQTPISEDLMSKYKNVKLRNQWKVDIHSQNRVSDLKPVIQLLNRFLECVDHKMTFNCQVYYLCVCWI